MRAPWVRILQWLDTNPVYCRERDTSCFRSRWLAWSTMFLVLGAAYVLTFLGMVFRNREVLALDVAYLPTWCEWLAGLIGVFVFNGAFSDEYQGRSIPFLVSTPLGRGRIVLGKLLGRSCALFYAFCAWIPLCVLWSSLLELGRVPVRPLVFYAEFGGYLDGWGRPVYAALIAVQTAGAFLLAGAITLSVSAWLRRYWMNIALSIVAVALALLLLYPPDKGISLVRIAVLEIAFPAAILVWLSRRLDRFLCRGL